MGAIGAPFTMAGAPAFQFANTSVFVERTVVDQQQVVKIDPSIPSVCAALSDAACSPASARSATAAVAPGDTVAVFGIGGVGLNVVQGARLATAARIVAVDTNPAKESIVWTFGATHFLASANAADDLLDLVPGGVDHAFVCIGSPALVRTGVDVLVGQVRRDRRLSRPGSRRRVRGGPCLPRQVDSRLPLRFVEPASRHRVARRALPRRASPARRARHPHSSARRVPPTAFADMATGRWMPGPCSPSEGAVDMPHIKLYATAGRTPEQKRALLESAHQGLVEGAGIPDWDRQVRLIEFGPDNILLPEKDDLVSYVLIEVFGYPRRSTSSETSTRRW